MRVMQPWQRAGWICAVIVGCNECACACTQVLASIGQLEFFYDQAPDVMRSCSMALQLLSVAAGSYLSGPFCTSLHSFVLSFGCLFHFVIIHGTWTIFMSVFTHGRLWPGEQSAATKTSLLVIGHMGLCNAIAVD